MGNLLMDKKIDELGQIRFALDDFKVGHLGVDELPGDSVEVDFDCALGIFIAHVSGLSKKEFTL